ncbi:aminotransferase class I/II-fold pyridoxal phosphate-dependent enzyme [Serratia sp. NPDC078593]|uniref:aminotransferase class I/II-fold pyridoxal phosphate-dependent enzyme n=1 Tax=unclassified Serratia (in: enterobacteria) TaxID=2647522 RepID=UPI0037D649C0
MLTRAIDSYQNIATLDDSATQLNLAWTQDEREFIQPAISDVIQQRLQTEMGEGLPDTYRYAVDDPWGDLVLRPAVHRYFSLRHDAFSLSCGAGVIALLAALAHLPHGQRVAIAGDVYPDYPWWLQHAGRQAWRLDTDSPWGMAEAALAGGAELVFMERPGLLADGFGDLAILRTLCQALAERGVLLLIDESNANYYPAAYSAVSLIHEMPNLMVLRGLSKAWGMGGLRVGFCLCSRELQSRVRQAIPPLLNTPLALRMAADILSLGDSTAALRAQISTHKPRMVALLGTQSMAEASTGLPYVFLPESQAAMLAEKGIKGKRHGCWQGDDTLTNLMRFSVPLLPERLANFEQRLRR